MSDWGDHSAEPIVGTSTSLRGLEAVGGGRPQLRLRSSDETADEHHSSPVRREQRSVIDGVTSEDLAGSGRG